MGLAGCNYFHRVILHTFFLIFANLLWFGGWGLGLWSLIGLLGLGFSADGVWGLWCWAFCGFIGLGLTI